MLWQGGHRADLAWWDSRLQAVWGPMGAGSESLCEDWEWVWLFLTREILELL